MSNVTIGVIGGSGLYDMPELGQVEERTLETPFGSPSAPITIGTLHGQRVAFLPRHGRGHIYSPSTIPYRANIYALKMLGVKYIVSVSACGSLRTAFEPGHIVVPDQLVDFTKGKRQSTFFDDGFVAHVGAADPFSPELGDALVDALHAAGATAHHGGRFITIEGPRFSTRAESHLFRQWGMSIIGMTTSPEAFLAAEAEIAYAVMAHVTDYDVWHDTVEPVSVDMVIATMSENITVAQRAIKHLVSQCDDWMGDYEAHHALAQAILTDPAQVPASVRNRLALLVGRYLN